jgi:hypothetical protein
LRLRISAWWTSRSINGGGDDLVAEDLAPAGERLVAGGRSGSPAHSGPWVEGDVADLVDDQQRDPLELAQLLGQLPLPLRIAEPRYPFRGGGEGLGGRTLIPSAIARCVLPVPGGPKRTTFSLAWRRSSCPRCSTSVFCTERWKLKSNSSSVLRAGKGPALIRASQLAQGAGVLERRRGAVAGEGALVAADELAGVEAGGDDLALRDPDLDPRPTRRGSQVSKRT